MKKNIYVLIFLLFYASSLQSQITISSVLKSNKLDGKEEAINVPILKMPEFNLEQIILEDEINEKQIDLPLRFAKIFEVDIDIKDLGLKDILENGEGTIWRLKIQSKGAFSLNLVFEEFELPKGAELFVYNSDKTQIIGALTELNNNDSRVVPIQPVKGDMVTIEYYEPKITDFKSKLKLKKVGHDYRGILNKNESYDGAFGTSQSCNVDINCTEGDNWQNESHSVCRLVITKSTGVYYCTGSLVNNVNNDGRAYVVTANHCITTTSHANNTVFIFNYESPTCGGTDGSVAQSISNSTLRSTWSTSDFTLTELSSVPPANFNPYWNGWNNQNNTPSAPVRCIHHPSGDVKKISRDDSTPSTYNTNFWKVLDWTVGTVEHGSSGAPFYDNNRRVVGYVSGGNNIFCGSSEESWYGKFSSSWTGGLTNATRLQNWLDPSNTTSVLPGLRLIRNATINTNTPASGDIVRFENVSVQNGSNITVVFDERFETTGTFMAPAGTTLKITPNL